MTRRATVRAICLALAMTLFGCDAGATASTDGGAKTDFFAMNTFMSIEVRGREAEKAVTAAREEVYRLEKLLSRTDPLSEVSAINAAAGSDWTTVSDETMLLIETAIFYAESTGGAFDITVAPVMDIWGFSSGQNRVPDGAEIESARSAVGYDRIRIDKSGGRVLLADIGMSLDLGGIAKGYAGDRVLEIIREYDIDAALISLGGNVSVYGRKPDGSSFRVAIKDPVDGNSYLGVLSAYDTDVVTSGGYERFFERDGKVYIHIMDPGTGRPAESDLLSVSVIDKNGMKSDILSTALFVMGKDEAIRYWKEHGDFGLVMATSSGEVLVSKNLKGLFTVTKGKSVTYFG